MPGTMQIKKTLHPQGAHSVWATQSGKSATLLPSSVESTDEGILICSEKSDGLSELWGWAEEAPKARDTELNIERLLEQST